MTDTLRQIYTKTHTSQLMLFNYSKIINLPMQNDFQRMTYKIAEETKYEETQNKFWLLLFSYIGTGVCEERLRFVRRI